MDVGCGHVISDRFFPENENTGFFDPLGNPLHTQDTVRISGCKADKGIIGRGWCGGYSVYFGTKNASVEWPLDSSTIQKIRKIIEGE